MAEDEHRDDLAVDLLPMAEKDIDPPGDWDRVVEILATLDTLDATARETALIEARAAGGKDRSLHALIERAARDHARM